MVIIGYYFCIMDFIMLFIAISITVGFAILGILLFNSNANYKTKEANKVNPILSELAMYYGGKFSNYNYNALGKNIPFFGNAKFIYRELDFNVSVFNIDSDTTDVDGRTCIEITTPENIHLPNFSLRKRLYKREENFYNITDIRKYFKGNIDFFSPITQSKIFALAKRAYKLEYKKNFFKKKVFILK